MTPDAASGGGGVLSAMGTTQKHSRLILQRLEGQRVNLALRGGTRIDDAELVSAGHGGELWLFTNGSDLFVPLSDVIDLWETVRSSAAA